jgi:hypothetical protein
MLATGALLVSLNQVNLRQAISDKSKFRRHGTALGLLLVLFRLTHQGLIAFFEVTSFADRFWPLFAT